MSKHTYRIAFIASVEHSDACNRAANALGRSGANFSVKLSESGQEPATHLGGSAVETEAFMNALFAAPGLPIDIHWPETLKIEDWQTVNDHLKIKLSLSHEVEPSDQFKELIEENGLRIIE